MRMKEFEAKYKKAKQKLQLKNDEGFKNKEQLEELQLENA